MMMDSDGRSCEDAVPMDSSCEISPRSLFCMHCGNEVPFYEYQVHAARCALNLPQQ